MKWVRASDMPPREETVAICAKYVTIVTEFHKQHHDEYWFDLHRTDTPLKLIQRIRHLSGKVWFDRGTCQELINKVCGHFGWDINIMT